MCYMLAREGAVRRLVEICGCGKAAFTRSKALRALATLCCVPECVEELEKHRGTELLLALLSDHSVPDSVSGRIGVVSDRIGVVSGRIGVVSGRIGVVSGRIGVVSGRIGVVR